MLLQNYLHDYTTIKNTMPYAYGDSTPGVLISRGFHVLNGTPPNQKNIKIKKNIPSEPTINIYYRKTEYCNTDSFAKDFAREIVLSLSVSLTKTVLDNLELDRNIQMALICAIVLGLVKGTVKSTSDILATKNASLANMPLKCTLDVFAEIAAVIIIQISHLQWYSAPKSALKAFFKYIFKHYALGLSILMIKTELSLEMLKAAFKGLLRACFRSTFIDFIPLVGHIMGPMLGSILGAILINIFIHQCTLSA